MTTPARNQLLLDLLRADLDFRLFQILEWLLSNIHFQKDFALFRTTLDEQNGIGGI